MFFAALFILMETLTELGLITWLADIMTSIISSVPEGQGRLVVALLILIWVSGIASAFMEYVKLKARKMGRDEGIQI